MTNLRFLEENPDFVLLVRTSQAEKVELTSEITDRIDSKFPPTLLTLVLVERNLESPE